MRDALVALCVLAAAVCGCGDDEDRSELVRYEVDGVEARTQADEPGGSSPLNSTIIPDSLLVIRSDGGATYRLADRTPVEFRVPETGLSKLRNQLDGIDFEAATRELGDRAEPGFLLISVTHDGRTVLLGHKFSEINYGEGPAVADQMSDLLGHLDRLLARTPEIDEARNRFFDEVLGFAPNATPGRAEQFGIRRADCVRPDTAIERRTCEVLRNRTKP